MRLDEEDVESTVDAERNRKMKCEDLAYYPSPSPLDKFMTIVHCSPDICVPQTLSVEALLLLMYLPNMNDRLPSKNSSSSTGDSDGNNPFGDSSPTVQEEVSIFSGHIRFRTTRSAKAAAAGVVTILGAVIYLIVQNIRYEKA